MMLTLCSAKIFFRSDFLHSKAPKASHDEEVLFGPVVLHGVAHFELFRGVGDGMTYETKES